ncbi:TIM barrel protein [Methylomonas sp. AM2-LC]|uniref:hydroxypyruvate isomerase family protein n=1 Tax=Methylomonas sp. AM2-LC TaxID=3153301 RepID=UPI003266D2E2
MLRFSANLSLLLTEYAWLERFAAAKQQGFQAVEIQFPYHLPVKQLQNALQSNGLQLVLFNVDADNLLHGGEGLAAVPEKQAEFKQAVAQTAAYAELLQPVAINVLSGRCLDKNRLTTYLDTFKHNLRYATEVFAELGINTVFEAINSVDMPGFIVDSSQQMLEILTEINHPRLGLQYDIYHMTRMGENCLAFLQTHMDKITHIQFADCPGRGEPGTGDIDFANIFACIAQSTYKGWLGAEYNPTTDSHSSFNWLAAATQTSAAVL